MKKVIRLTESDLIRIVKRVINEEEYSRSFVRRFFQLDDDMIDLISQAKDEVDEDDFNDYYDYLDNVVYSVVQELQYRYGKHDNFWFDSEDEITDYIKDEYDDYLYD